MNPATRSLAARLPRLVVLTDRTQLPARRCLVETIIECRRAGLGAVVVREHDLEAYARRALVAQLAQVPGLWVISSRLPDPAAHGLHLASHQPPPRPWSGRARRWGRSCHSRSEVARAAAEGAAWATLSPFAATRSKPGYGPALPADAWAEHDIPVLALGGLTPDNAARAREAGAYGVAVMGEVMRADRPGDVVDQLLEAVR
ncbi:thiamine phosphate synthase [Nocardioides jishulii]|uniref:Thiamine phosphate synthase n=1 Tax=Nocardioides jishulii TaxID=2575440 RepID=A0A4U2YH24_9ACTN|nr:thiamine phosphate synthase [Nocardioides jishulii]QCX26703.1 thiamine phosphate synthase [Nocardioides jishulii]TKI60327.1 thiamine phosphate synthase [Nocardioides jishulii]